MERGVLPYAFGGMAGAALFGGGLDGDNLESVTQRPERLVGKESLGRLLRVVDEGVHLLFRISFGQESDVDALGGVRGP